MKTKNIFLSTPGVADDLADRMLDPFVRENPLYPVLSPIAAIPSDSRGGYESLSNFELNKLIAERRQLNFEITHAFHNTGEDVSGHYCDQAVWMTIGKPKFGRAYNPAGDWRDAGILAEEEKMSIIPFDDKWDVAGYKRIRDTSPTRAICIAWLYNNDEQENKI